MKSTFSGLAVFGLVLLLAMPVSAQPSKTLPSDLHYIEATDLNLIGKIIEPTTNPYHRVDTTLYKGFNVAENTLVRLSSGLAVLFRTNSTSITVKADYAYANMGWNTMGAALRGFDLYIKEGGEWIYAGAKCPKEYKEIRKQPQVVNLIKGMDSSMKECLLYLPVYSEMKSVQVGVDQDAEIAALESPFRHRIGVFGSSFTHGISISRSGMSWPQQFMRHTGLQVLSLGCSGNSKLQPQFAAVLADADVDAFIFDAFSNPTPEMIRERLFPFIEKIRTKHPHTPLIFMQTIYREGRNFSREVDEYEQEKMDVAEEMMAQAMKKYQDVYFIIPDTGKEARETSCDGIHPTDMGYLAWSRSIEKPVLKILRKYGIR